MPSWIEKELEGSKVSYRTDHHPTEYTAQAVARRERVPGIRFAKVVVVLVDHDPALLVMAAYDHVDLLRAAIALSAHEVRLATEEEIARRFPDVAVGAIPPLRHWRGVELWMDASLRHEGEFVFQAGTHEDVIRLDFADWMRVAAPRIANFIRPTFIGA